MSRWRGDVAETLGRAYLAKQGYRLLNHNYHAHRGELDVVAWEGKVLCFVEIKARKDHDFGLPQEMVNQRKQRSLIYAAKQFLMSVAQPWPPMRFDVLAIDLTTPPHFVLVRAAFEL